MFEDCFLEPYLDSANNTTLVIFLSLPILVPPRPSRASKCTFTDIRDISTTLVRRFPTGASLFIY
ncbi:hypothetical protein OUZ56_029655 [Daphnia magna]|uniref:Uncharacterized protein n=1 Tax=Daphnia magna TaxID=35525 RepID=A0ABR0B7H2_9CRUS|nr:hypothetical protein OUZ56_029655 [Daphnia magna]